MLRYWVSACCVYVYFCISLYFYIYICVFFLYFKFFSASLDCWLLATAVLTWILLAILLFRLLFPSFSSFSHISLCVGAANKWMVRINKNTQKYRINLPSPVFFFFLFLIFHLLLYAMCEYFINDEIVMHNVALVWWIHCERTG